MRKLIGIATCVLATAVLLPAAASAEGGADLGELDGRTDVLVHGRVRVHREADHRGRNRAHVRIGSGHGDHEPPRAHVRLDIEGRVDL